MLTPRCLVVGEALVDVVDGLPHAGGSPMNMAVGLARLGLDTRLLTRIGDDEFGRMLEDHLVREGVALTAASLRVGGRTSRATAVIGDDGAAVYDFDIEWTLSESDAIAEAAEADLIHVGSIGAALEPGAGAVQAMLATVPSGTLRTYDPNIRPALLGPRADAAVRVEAIMAASHVVKLSDEDADWLYPGRSVEDVLAHVLALGARMAVVTRGGAGCVTAIAGAGEPVARGASPVTVVDTIGAGDAFMSGLVYGIVSGGLVAALTADVFAPDADVLRALERAADTALASAAVAVSRTGAAPPHLHELEQSSVL
ncbi:PfkB family carbohydrate kinase [Microbacterium phyllosphaerae]|uniref:PfkB family carbohydrate kinase n=1 Tax=Microbacterium phyllosphaerae TaxID=124798 RepID=UPI003D651D17